MFANISNRNLLQLAVQAEDRFFDYIGARLDGVPQAELETEQALLTLFDQAGWELDRRSGSDWIEDDDRDIPVD